MHVQSSFNTMYICKPLSAQCQIIQSSYIFKLAKLIMQYPQYSTESGYRQTQAVMHRNSYHVFILEDMRRSACLSTITRTSWGICQTIYIHSSESVIIYSSYSFSYNFYICPALRVCYRHVKHFSGLPLDTICIETTTQAPLGCLGVLVVDELCLHSSAVLWLAGR